MTTTTKILIAETQTILRAGLRALLNTESDFAVVGEADNAGDTLRLIDELTPDLVMIDIDLPGADGCAVSALRAHYPQLPLLVIMQHQTETGIRAALATGANGYVSKETTNLELVMAVRSVLNGGVFLSSSISEKMIDAFLVGGSAVKTESQWDSLTGREREVLQLVAQGYTNRYIAERLALSVKTVEKHRSNLMKKLDLHNASALTTFAIGKGLVAAG